ncbi:tripartite tricarboxylate transporter permease [uncultured Halomonas sp.]|uniref:tripartite tricarboxylate transporter permease n=1 Tax=Halomonas mongoliensis TaxID=321265 RepID=UPI00260642D4|nr:tripartite tricarboxylate transporter permease [uncultured Halomonas sp.]
MIIDNFAQGFDLFLSWGNFLAILIGVLVGIVFGAIPGLTGTMAVALVLPFTFTLAPVTGILLLVGVYKGAVYGGSIPAILIKTPGTPGGACTVMDGYPLARQGKAGKALNMALYSSACADFISNLALIFLAGFIAAFALRFGPPEFFALMCFSLTIIAGVSGSSLMKGLASAALGLLLASVGLDIIFGTPRFAFGEVELTAGINFIPILIGLFAMPEIINQFTKRYGVSTRIAEAANARVSWQEFKGSIRTILRGSFIGVILGAIPGIGGAPAAFVSYGAAQRASKNGDNFGKGELEGVAASEAGNNGVCGATMIPLLSLGVPGDVITAVILGAFMIHGLTPGPLLFQENIDIVYAIFCGILLSSVFMVMWGKLGIRLFARIADIPNTILFPVVLVLCVFGAYAVNSNPFDVLVMFLVGILGFGMLKANIPPAPFLIAFVLGPMLENNLRRALQVSNGDYSILLRNEITIFFLVLTVVSLILITVRNLKRWRQRTIARRADTALAD